MTTHEATHSASGLTGEPVVKDWPVAVLALAVLLAAALGVPHDELLQDTYKSMVVSFGALGAAACFFWRQRRHREGPRWPALLWLPVMLMTYALGSMAWSHTYLAGVEAVRWFVFSLLLFVGANTLDGAARAPVLRAIHWGACVASLWTALQFLIDLSWFPQGPQPASTFVNRNFFAEFVVSTLPVSAWLLVQARQRGEALALALGLGLNIAALLMTGTRSALLAISILALLLPPFLLRYWRQLPVSGWGRRQQVLVLGLLLGLLGSLSVAPTGNPTIAAEELGRTALERSVYRGVSLAQPVEYREGSASLRLLMWQATGRMIADHPLAGVGAGAWEVEQPLYQESGAQLETDYYVHNELLQIVAEYGLAGWIFLFALLAYLCLAAWRTWRLDSPQGREEAPFRVAVLSSLLALLVVSCAGFPWRLAGTGALFAVLLALLLASDRQLGLVATRPGHRWTANLSHSVLAGLALCTALAVYITQQAVLAEGSLIRSIKIAMRISAAGDVKDARWAPAKQKMLTLARQGIALNPHYRKLTPLLADQLAVWGDAKNALWIWESVLASRPHVVAMLANAGRAAMHLGDRDKAQAYLVRAEALQPRAPAVASLEVALLRQAGHEAQALHRAQAWLAQDVYDFDLVHSAYELAAKRQDWPLALRALALRSRQWPVWTADGWLRTAAIQANGLHDDAQALNAYRAALNSVPADQAPSVRQHIPARFLTRLPAAEVAP